MSEVFVTEREVWVIVRARVCAAKSSTGRIWIHGKSCIRTIEIHLCDTQGRRVGDAAIRESPGAYQLCTR